LNKVKKIKVRFFKNSIHKNKGRKRVDERDIQEIARW
jgi:hypothetical protein